MSIPGCDSKVLSRTLFALLFYYKSGSYRVFKLLVDKFLKYHFIHFDKIDSNYIHRLLFDRLLVFGILESCWDNSTRLWEITSNKLIEIDPNKYVVIGDEEFVRNLKTKFLHNDWSALDIYNLPKDTGIDLSITLDVLIAGVDELGKVSGDLRFDILSKNHKNLFGVIPSVRFISKQASASKVQAAEIQSAEMFKFNFEFLKWEDSDNALTQGYYRIPHVFGQHREFIVSENRNKLLAHEINNREWSFSLASYILNEKIICGYVRNDNELLIPYKIMPLLPSIVRRALCVKSFYWPASIAGSYAFGDISREDISMLKNILPFTKIDYVE